jgi:hypothetical protein
MNSSSRARFFIAPGVRQSMKGILISSVLSLTVSVFFDSRGRVSSPSEVSPVSLLQRCAWSLGCKTQMFLSAFHGSAFRDRASTQVCPPGSEWPVIQEECERCWGPSMQLASGGTCAFQTCIIGSPGNASDHLLARDLVCSRIRHEHGNRNSPSVR